MTRIMVIALVAVVSSIFASASFAEQRGSAPPMTPGQRCTNSYGLCVRDCYVVHGTGTDPEATNCTKMCSDLYRTCKASLPRAGSPTPMKPKDAAKTLAPTR